MINFLGVPTDLFLCAGSASFLVEVVVGVEVARLHPRGHGGLRQHEPCLLWTHLVLAQLAIRVDAHAHAVVHHPEQLLFVLGSLWQRSVFLHGMLHAQLVGHSADHGSIVVSPGDFVAIDAHVMPPPLPREAYGHGDAVHDLGVIERGLVFFGGHEAKDALFRVVEWLIHGRIACGLFLKSVKGNLGGSYGGAIVAIDVE